MRVAEALLAITLATGLTGSLVAWQSPPLTLRFHHAHYRVGDPATAMNVAAQRLEGVRVIVQGLGVGVRAGREYLLFDRAGADDGSYAGRSARTAYPLAVQQLKAWGFQVEPEAVGHVRVTAALPDLYACRMRCS